MNCQMILVIYIIPKVDLGQSNVRCKKSMVGWWSASESVSWSPFSPGFFMNYTEGHRTQIIIKTSPRRTCVHGYSSILFFFFFFLVLGFDIFSFWGLTYLISIQLNDWVLDLDLLAFGHHIASLCGIQRNTI